MDADVEDLLAHLSGQLSNPSEFFEAVHTVYEEHEEADFDAFCSAFHAKGFAPADEELTRYLDDHGRLDLLAKVVQERPESLASTFAELEAAEADAGSEADPGEQAAAWKAVLTEYSGTWDGNEENWQAFEDYVRYYAEEAGVLAQAEIFFDRARSEDKVALFAEYEVELQLPADGAVEDGADAGAALWQQAIEQFGSAWADWDGSETGWAEYRDWFYDAANSQDPNMYAAAYERMDPLNSLALDERIDRLREFGFDVAAGGDATAGADGEVAYDRDSTFPWVAEIGTALGDQWDGTDDGWPAFREAVVAGVEQQSGGRVDLVAAGAGFLDEIEAAGDKRAALAEYGVVLAGAGDDEAEVAPEAATEALQEVLDDLDMDLSEFSEEEVKQALEQALAEVSADAN